VSTIGNRIADWWFAPAPAERLAMLRIAIGVFAFGWVTGRLPELYRLAGSTKWRPVGLTRILEEPLPPTVALAIGIATSIALALFVLGVRFRLVGPIAAVLLTWTLCYRNSWAMPFHTENLLVLHVIVLAIAPAADVWAWTKRPASQLGYGWAIKLMIALTAATYLLAGIAKLRLAGVAWADGETLRDHIAIDNLRKLMLGDAMAPLATTLLDHPGILRVFSMMSFAMELGAPIALVGGRIGRLWAYGTWGFHVGVIFLMNIWFPYPVFGFAFLPLFPVERVGTWLIGRWREWRHRSPG
jgi:hypothetical protein